MNCSQCGALMEDGRVEVHNSPGTILFKTWSLQDLYWYDKLAKRKSRRRLVESGPALRGHHLCWIQMMTLDQNVGQTVQVRSHE
jgi:hypothetical protein